MVDISPWLVYLVRPVSSESSYLICLSKFILILGYLTGVISGPNHKWLNNMDQNGVQVNQDGVFLVIVNSYFGDSALVNHREMSVMFEKVKLLQQRWLY